MINRGFRLLLLLLVLGSVLPALADNAAFTVRDIRVEGVQRITAGTVFNYLPIKVGETIDSARISEAIRVLYRTGFFSDIAIYREGEVLMLQVKERPSIGSLSITGNQDIPTESLMSGLKENGFTEGEIFNSTLLDSIEQELRRQYFSQGKYGVTIDSVVTPLDNNRVDVAVTIYEGVAATISEINIVGNRTFTERELLDQFELASTRDAWMGSSDDQYSKQRLSGDLERLRSFYMDRGFVHFGIDSTQVAISPEKENIYITINISEGDQYRVSQVKLAGDLILPEEKIRGLVSVAEGELFSRKEVTLSSSRVTEALGAEGYAFANVNGIPEIDETTKTVGLTFYVDPGKRAYVNRINIKGNVKTDDEVIRREFRQFESGWVDNTKINRSRTRAERLGFFDTVTVETPPVPGTSDQLDVNINVVERPSGQLMLSVGYSEDVGAILNTSVSENNFAGSGNRVEFSIDNSSVNETYKFTYFNPYHTLDGISRGFSLYRQKTDTDSTDIINYAAETNGGSVTYGIPMSEFDDVRVTLRYDDTVLKLGDSASKAVQDFVDENGDRYDTLTTELAWTHDTRNRTIFASEGSFSRIGLEYAMPGGDLQYYKARYEYRWHRPLGAGFGFNFRGRLAYGEGYGDQEELPFFENFFAGGIQTVRGFTSSSLGPRDPDTDDPTGGNLQTVANLELVLPIQEDNNSVQVFSFLDGGNVFDTNVEEFDESELRYSAGVALAWLSPIGPFIFVLAEPLNDQPEDRLRKFQFSIGVPF